MFFSGEDEAYHSSNTILFLLFLVVLEYLINIGPFLQEGCSCKKSLIFPIQRHSFGKHSNSQNRSNISIFNTEKQWEWRVCEMPSLGDHFLFLSSSKKLERCNIRVTLQCAVAEHTEFLPKEKKSLFFFPLSLKNKNASAIAQKKSLQKPDLA